MRACEQVESTKSSVQLCAWMNNDLGQVRYEVTTSRGNQLCFLPGPPLLNTWISTDRNDYIK